MSKRIQAIFLSTAFALPFVVPVAGSVPMRAAASSTTLTATTGNGIWACIGALIALAGAYIDGDQGDKDAARALVKEAC